MSSIHSGSDSGERGGGLGPLLSYNIHFTMSLH